MDLSTAPIYAAPLLAVCAVYLVAWLAYEALAHLRSDDGVLGRREHRRRVAQAATHRKQAKARLNLSLTLPR